MAKPKKQTELEQKVGELTLDLQRTRADFENYRKRVDGEKQDAGKRGEMRAVMKLLPVIDTIERAIEHIPAELADNAWAQGVAGLQKQLDKMMTELKLERITSTPGTVFDPDYHQAVQFDESAEGEQEVIESELQPGYIYDGAPLRHAMVKVTKQ